MHLTVNRPTLLLLTILSIVSLFITYLHIEDTSSKNQLIQRLKQLQDLNGRLHRDIGILSDELEQESMEKLVQRTKEHLSINDSVMMDGVQTSCETIQIAMVAAGVSTARNVTTLVKSILFYRHNPLHFHILTDAAGLHILSIVFRTWQLPAVNVSFYSTEPLIEKVSWIPNSHYSGIFGLLKLTLPSVLPDSLKHVIVLDTDLMFSSDIAGLSKFFDEMKRQQKLMGLTENLSDWYLGNLWEMHRPWPALGRGFNTGVILLNLQAMREEGWDDIWKQITNKTLQKYRVTALADQDIINVLIKENQNIHYVLPCAWNVQMSEHTLSHYCLDMATQFKIIHWNSPEKLEVQQNYGPYFKSLYNMFESYDGGLFRTALLRCSTSTTPATLTAANKGARESPCSEFKREGGSIRRTHPYILEYQWQNAPIDQHDITLVAQLSVDRLQILEPLCRQWEGPLSIALYATDSEVKEILHYFSRSTFFKEYIKTSKLALHVVYKSGHNYYPVNYLRNVALNNIQTPYVFLSDIDFLPMYHLYLYLREVIRVLGSEKRAFVVPAFQTLRYRFTYPQSKPELLKMLDKGEVYTFRYHTWKEGHAPTNYEHWRTATVPYKVNWVENFEPYVVISSNATRYDERFVGFGWNKVSHIMELNAQDYDFVVLNNAFMIHMPHAPSLDIADFRNNKRYRDCVAVLKREFRQELLEKYGL